MALSEDDIVVFVGPNNAGKSAALRDLEKLIRHGDDPSQVCYVIKNATLTKTGSEDELLHFLANNTNVTGASPARTFQSGRAGGIPEGPARQWWRGTLNSLGPLFFLRIPTEQRIIDGNPTGANDMLKHQPGHPIQWLYLRDDLELKLSQIFRRAFGEDLIVYRLNGSQIPLLVGERPVPSEGEDRLSIGYNKRLMEQALELQSQGDGMRSFATVILRLFASGGASIVLLDEPEAFLHPPQARLLGETIARHRSTAQQLFIATHSEDVLQGLFNVTRGKLRIVRLQRSGSVNRVRELDRTLAQKISADPLMRYSGVLSGVFHQRAIVCEADSDCMFYSSILDLPSVNGADAPDALFVQSNGKHRMASLAETLRAFDVPVDVIADIDVLNDLDVLERIVNALGGDWASIESHAKIVQNSVENGTKWLDASEVAKQIAEIVRQPQQPGSFPSSKAEEIKKVLGKSSPWAIVKNAGQAAIPAGDATKRLNILFQLCSEIGLWIVPVGEVEGFCKSQGDHGPKWVRRVLEEHDIATSPELQAARDFVGRIWSRLRPQGPL